MKFKLKRLLVLALSFAVIGGAAGFSASIVAKAADTYEFALIESLPTSVYKGDTLTVPKAKFGSLNAKHYVYAPDGTVYSGNSVSCTTHGVYTVKYYASSEQGMLTHVEKITVENPAYYFDGAGSSAKWVENEEVTGRNGLLVNLKKGEKFYFNDLIDMNACNASQPAIKFTLAPQVANQNDAQEFTVTFTDAYNPENSVSYWFNLGYGNTSSAWNYMRAKASGQTYKGFEGSKLHVNTFGTPFTFYAKDSFKDENIDINGVLGKQYLSFYVDKDTREAHLGYYHFKTKGSLSGKIVDLDDVSYQEADWNGFTTGEVYVSIECDKYISDSANILLLSVGDKDLSAGKFLDDNEAPEITVDTLGYTEVPAASKGLSYPVFAASSFDRQSGGAIDLTAKVYYAYTRNSGVYHEVGAKYAEEVAIENGYFKTTKTGVYSIVYTSYDYAGNYTELVVNVTCGDAITEISGVSLKAGYATTAQVCNKVKLAEIAEGVSGGVGELSEKFAVTHNGDTQTVYGNSVNGYWFIPAGAGEYKVNAGVEDMLKNFKCVSYVVNVAAQTSPAFIEEPVLPKYLVEGAEYVLPEAYGKLAGESEVQEASVTVTDGEGSRDYELGSTVSFTADASGNAAIKYCFGDNAIETVIPVISVINDDETLNLRNYFVESGDLVVTLESAGAKFSAQSGSVEFIRDLVASGLSFTANLSEVGDRVDFNLTDGADKSQKITASFIAEKSGYISAWVCGELISAKFAKITEPKALAISYDQAGGYLYLTSSIRAKLKTTAYGEAFNGFTSGKVYASLDLSNATAYISQINSQKINSSIERDSVAPAIVMAGDYGELYREKGEILTVMDAFAADVLSPYTSMTLRVTDPNGNFVTAVDGTVLSGINLEGGKKIEVKLSEFGSYTVFYFAKDWANKNKTISYTITVGDTKAPDLSLSGEIASIQKIGWIKLPSVNVTDDVTTLPRIIISVISPSFKPTILGDDLEYYVSEKGNYSVTYMVIDAAGNTAVIKRSFEVR